MVTVQNMHRLSRVEYINDVVLRAYDSYLKVLIYKALSLSTESQDPTG